MLGKYAVQYAYGLLVFYYKQHADLHAGIPVPLIPVPMVGLTTPGLVSKKYQ